MPSISDTLADRFYAHAVHLERFSAGLQRRVLSQLKRLEKSLVAQLAAADVADGRPMTPFKRARLEQMLSQTRATISTAYNGIERAVADDLAEVAEIEVQWAASSVNGAVGAAVLSVATPEATMASIAGNALIQGTPAAEWWAGQSRNLQTRFAAEMRQGMLRGETMGELARRIRGTRENGYADGILSGKTKQARRDAMALVSTAVQAVSNEARRAVYEANDDVLRGTEWLATLDFKTCPICQPLDHGAWDMQGKPLPESRYKGNDPGYPPRHYRCRCVKLPLLKPLDEITDNPWLRGVEIPPGTRASMDGQVSGEMTYEQWLEKKSPTQQDEVLGKGKAALWRAGKVDFQQLVDQSGRPLTLAQLRARV